MTVPHLVLNRAEEPAPVDRRTLLWVCGVAWLLFLLPGLLLTF